MENRSRTASGHATRSQTRRGRTQENIDATPQNQDRPENDDDDDDDRESQASQTRSEPEIEDDRLQRLKDLVASRRRQQVIEDLEEELRGGEQAQFDVEGLPARTRKRAHTRYTSDESTGEPQAKYMRMPDPPKYYGKSLNELRDYEIGWNLWLKAQPPMKESQRIALAAASLKDSAALEWVNADQDQINTWEQYLTFLRGIVKDPEARQLNASQKLKKLEQGYNYTAREVVTQAKSLWQDIPPMEDETRKAWEVLNMLRPDVRNAVMQTNQPIRSVDGVLALAQRYEDLNPYLNRKHTQPSSSSSQSYSGTQGRSIRRDADDSQAKRNEHPKDKGRKDKDKEKEEREKKQREDRREKGQCFSCGETGHRWNNCPKKNKGNASEKQVQAQAKTKN